MFNRDMFGKLRLSAVLAIAGWALLLYWHLTSRLTSPGIAGMLLGGPAGLVVHAAGRIGRGRGSGGMWPRVIAAVLVILGPLVAMMVAPISAAAYFLGLGISFNCAEVGATLEALWGNPTTHGSREPTDDSDF